MIQPDSKARLQSFKNTFWHLPKAIFYHHLYGRPSSKLILIGVTGTDGKTTTSSLIHESLIHAGINAGIISTLGAKIGDKEIKLGLHTTSPDPSIVQKIFRQMVDQGITHVVVEVTAHAMDQYRYYGCHFKVSVITNVTHEHLDDFVNLTQYTLAKSKLFLNSETSILNRDDPSYDIIYPLLNKKVVSYSINQPSDYQAKNIVLDHHNLTFKVDKISLKTDSLFYYQIYNILAAYIVLKQINYDIQLFIDLIQHFPEMKGRREEVKNDSQIRSIVDFAHTPNALKTTLESLRITTSGKLIVIFGATGGRDPSKRPLMGKVVSELADVAYITADDTRSEKVSDINNQIISGIDQDRIKQKKFIFYNIPNRQDAFNQAVKLALPGDTIVACGKGHETTILHGKTEYPWSESEAFRTAFRSRT